MNPIKTINPSDIKPNELHSFLLSAIAPRPICFASTIDADGKVNLSPFSFFNVFSSNPPIMVFSPAKSGRTNTHKDTFKNIQEVKEVVINVVNYPIVEQMSLSSTSYERGVNEFEKAGLTQIPSEMIKPPRVGEAPVAFECLVQQVIELGENPGSGNLIIARVVLMHVQESYLNDQGLPDIHQLDLVARMGGNWYCRAIPESLFEIAKPIRSKGIGVDQLPESIRNSEVLTGNNLGRLGNVAALPSQEEVLSLKNDPKVQALLGDLNGAEIALHRLAQRWLERGETERALGVLLLADSLLG